MKAIHDTLALQAYFIAHAPAEPPTVVSASDAAPSAV